MTSMTKARGRKAKPAAAPASDDVCPICAGMGEDRRYNAETEAAIEEGRAIADGRIKVKTYDSAREMFADLEAGSDA